MEKQDTSSTGIITTSNSRDFGDDLLTEILSRLPIKSIFRFKSVSKGWCSLISDESFQERLIWKMSGLFYRIWVVDPMGHYQLKEHRYVSILEEKSGSFSVTDMSSLTYMSLSFLPSHHDFRIVDCCNGLLLCLCEDSIYYICNPAKKKWITLPKPPKQGSLVNARVAFDPRSSCHYKVIRIWSCSRWQYNSIVLEIFCSSTGKWTESEVSFETSIHFSPEQKTVFLNGTLYILVYYSCIMGISIDEGTYRRIKLPSKHHRGYLGESGGHLYYAEPNGNQLQIWTLLECDNEWVLKQRISFRALLERIPQAIICGCRAVFQPLDFHPNFPIIFLRRHCKIFAYHLTSKMVEEVSSLSCEGDCSYHFSAFPYTPWIMTAKAANGEYDTSSCYFLN